MFGVDSSEFLLCLLVAVVVIGPKELPGVLRTVGRYVGKARNMASQFRLGLDQMVRDTELADLEKKWREQNDEIMRAFPTADSAPEAAWDGGKPLAGNPGGPAAGPEAGRVNLDKPAESGDDGYGNAYGDTDWGAAPVPQPFAAAPASRSGKAAPRPPVTGQAMSPTPMRTEGQRVSAARPSLPPLVVEPEPVMLAKQPAPEPAPTRGVRRAPSGRRPPRAAGPGA